METYACLLLNYFIMMKHILKQITFVAVFALVLTAGAQYSFAEGLNLDVIGNFSESNNFNEVITENDWNTLSEQAIDAKLVAAGQSTIFDANNPFYSLTISQIEALSSDEFETMAGDYFGDDLVFEDSAETQDFNDIISAEDWETLSEKAIDQKLINAGYMPIFDVNNPFYEMSVAELKELSEEEYLELAGTYYEG